MKSLYIPKFTMDDVHLANGPSPPLTMYLEKNIQNNSSVSIAIPMIIFTWFQTSHPHGIATSRFFVLNSGEQKFALTFWLVLILPTFVYHYVTVYFFFFSFDVSPLIKIVELNPLYNNIWNVFFWVIECGFKWIYGLCLKGSNGIYCVEIRLKNEQRKILCR